MSNILLRNLKRRSQDTGDNYEAAWELLTKRYEKRRKILSNHINRLMDLPNLNLESNKLI